MGHSIETCKKVVALDQKRNNLRSRIKSVEAEREVYVSRYIPFTTPSSYNGSYYGQSQSSMFEVPKDKVIQWINEQINEIDVELAAIC